MLGRRAVMLGLAVALMLPAVVVIGVAQPAGAVAVIDEAGFRAAWSDPSATSIELGASLVLSNCAAGVPTRNSATALTVTATGRPHTITQTCANQSVLVQQGQGALTFEGITLTGGHAPDQGGGLRTNSLSTTFNDSTVTGNGADAGGGGIYGGSMNAVITLNNSVVSHNGAGGQGGGILIEPANGVVNVNSSQVINNQSGNSTTGHGGGISSTLRVNLVDSTVSGNKAFSNGRGGGLLTGVLAATRSTISGNLSGTDGGGIASGNMTITNSTITQNHSSGGSSGGGGLFGSLIILKYTTVVDNESETGAANIAATHDGDAELQSFGSVIALKPGGTNCDSQFVFKSQGYNFSDDASCHLTALGDRQNAGNPQLGALSDNGGPTLTRMPANASPLVDIIPSARCAPGITSDQRGVTRPQGGTCDIGAVELDLPLGLDDPTAAPDAVLLDPTFTG